MGTRADFYVGKGKDSEWLGSIAWDGYPEGIDKSILESTSEKEYREAVGYFLTDRKDSTFPKQGWPWPWNNSGTTDYVYTIDKNMVWYSIGFPTNIWWPHCDGEPPNEDTDPEYREKTNKLEVCEFPNMTKIQNVTMGERSGLIVFKG